MPTPERRGASRLACDIDARLVLEELGEENVQTIDLSFSGICVLSLAYVPPRTRAEFFLKVVVADGESDTLSLTGETVWCTKVPDGHQVGARFDPDMNAATWRRLDVVLQLLRGELKIDVD